MSGAEDGRTVCRTVPSSAREAGSCYEDGPFMASARLRGRMSVQCSLM